MTKLLLDASNAWYRCYLASVLDPPGGPLYIFTRMMYKLCKKYGKNNVIVCWDNGHGGRKEIDPNYKAHRTSNQNVWEDIVYLYRMVEILGLQHARCEGFEADDIIGSLAVNVYSDSDVLINSYDKDFYQLVSNRIKVIRPERKMNGKIFPEQIIDNEGVKEEFNCAPNKVILLKAFRGDSSDNIPKLPIRFTQNFQKCFFEVVDKCSNVADFYKYVDVFDKKYHDDLIVFKERALLNEKLICINCNLTPTVSSNTLDTNGFEHLCRELEITKLKIGEWFDLPQETSDLPPVQGLLF